MQGDLAATSANGLTEFRLSLKLPLAKPPKNEEEKLPDEIIGRALAIEDERYNRMVLGWHLVRMGYQVDWADTGAAALERIRADVYDIIFTDIMLPDTTGDKLAKEIRNSVQLPDLPIIAVTAFSTPEKIEQARNAGISGFVTKPISREKLEAAIKGSSTTNRNAGESRVGAKIAYDFNTLLRLNEGRQRLAEYSESLIAAWAKTESKCHHESIAPDEARRLVHAMRSQVLVADAVGIAEQLALLEDAVAERRSGDAQTLVRVIRPMIDHLAQSAKTCAFAEITSRS